MSGAIVSAHLKMGDCRRAAMVMRIWKCVVAGSALFFLAPASAVVAADQVPIKGNVTIVPTQVPPKPISMNPPIVEVTRSITGIVSHLGACTGTIVEDINLRDLTFSGTFTLVAANGDTIVGTATGGLSFDPNNPGFFDVTEIFTITGGTGRFARAIGSAIGGGLADRTTSVAQESFEGTISSPGSLK
jgi:hypothetical protein